MWSLLIGRMKKFVGLQFNVFPCSSSLGANMEMKLLKAVFLTGWSLQKGLLCWLSLLHLSSVGITCSQPKMPREAEPATHRTVPSCILKPAYQHLPRPQIDSALGLNLSASPRLCSRSPSAWTPKSGFSRDPVSNQNSFFFPWHYTFKWTEDMWSTLVWVHSMSVRWLLSCPFYQLLLGLLPRGLGEAFPLCRHTCFLFHSLSSGFLSLSPLSILSPLYQNTFPVLTL